MTTTKVTKRGKPKFHWACVGIDLSMSSFSAFFISWDYVLKKNNTDYFRWAWDNEIDSFASRMHDFIRKDGIVDEVSLSLLKVSPSIEASRIYIAIEEPFPPGVKARSSSIKQQSMLSGALWVALMQRGYQNILEVGNSAWKRKVSRAIKTNVSVDKWLVKEWAIKEYNLPDWPDLIRHSKRGLIAKPETSKAKAVQPNDIYDAAGITHWLSKSIKV